MLCKPKDSIKNSLDSRLEIIADHRKRIAASDASVSVAINHNTQWRNDVANGCRPTSGIVRFVVVIANIRLICSTASWNHKAIVLRNDGDLALSGGGFLIVPGIRRFAGQLVAGQFGCLNWFIAWINVYRVLDYIRDRLLIFVRCAVVLKSTKN